MQCWRTEHNKPSSSSFHFISFHFVSFCSAVQYSTAQHSTAQHSKVQSEREKREGEKERKREGKKKGKKTSAYQARYSVPQQCSCPALSLANSFHPPGHHPSPISPISQSHLSIHPSIHPIRPSHHPIIPSHPLWGILELLGSASHAHAMYERAKEPHLLMDPDPNNRNGHSSKRVVFSGIASTRARTGVVEGGRTASPKSNQKVSTSLVFLDLRALVCSRIPKSSSLFPLCWFSRAPRLCCSCDILHCYLSHAPGILVLRLSFIVHATQQHMPWEQGNIRHEPIKFCF